VKVDEGFFSRHFECLANLICEGENIEALELVWANCGSE